MIIAEELGSDINCLLLPVGKLSLLVPSVCVAEVLPWRRIREVADAPGWLLGTLAWRGDVIPVVQFGVINSYSADADLAGATSRQVSHTACVAVMNRCKSAHGDAFYAIATDGLPRLMQMGQVDVVSEQVELGIAELAAVKLGREQFRIPNLGFVEDQLVSRRPMNSLRAL